MLLVKNLQFSSNPANILPKWLAEGWVLLIEYQLDWMNIADFLLIAHFLSNQADNLPKVPILELVILLRYQLDWMKIVDFLLIAYFWASPILYCSYFISDIKGNLKLFFCLRLKTLPMYCVSPFFSGNWLIEMNLWKEVSIFC